jgi:hypothetical protein
LDYPLGPQNSICRKALGQTGGLKKRHGFRERDRMKEKKTESNQFDTHQLDWSQNRKKCMIPFHF